MRHLRRILAHPALILMLATGVLTVRAAEPAGLPLKLTPETIEMRAFYSGAWLRIEGTIEAGSQVIVVVRGPEVEETFNVKGRVGPIWINSAKVHISGVPSLFQCFHSAPLDRLLSPQVLAPRQIGYEAIRKQMRIRPPQQDRDVVRTSFVTLKTEEHVYRNISNGVQMGQPTPAGVPFRVDFHWPRKAPPATYEVMVYECRDGVIVREAAASLKVVEVGFPAWMASVAREHASLYGGMAVIVAVLAGFGIDFLAVRLRRRLAGVPRSGER